MIGRYAFSIVIGVVITLSLLFVMHLLIEYGESALSKPRDRHMLEFVRVKRNETLNTEEITPEKPPKPPDKVPSQIRICCDDAGGIRLEAAAADGLAPVHPRPLSPGPVR